MTKVSLVKCNSYDATKLAKSIANSLENLGGLGNFIKYGDKVLLKPNMLLPKPADSCVTTNPHFVKAVAEIVKDFGGKPVMGDSPPIHSCYKVACKSGMAEELKKIDVPIIEFTTPTKLKSGAQSLFKDIYVAKEVLEADCVINLPKIKTHGIMTLTGCVKNMFGAIIGQQKSLWHLKAGERKEPFARMLVELCYGLSPALTIADMITTMEGNGPTDGIPKHVGLVIAGSDCVAMDAVICKILHIPQDLVYTLKEAKKLKPLSTNLMNIQIIGEDINETSASVKNFKLPKKFDADFGIPAPIKKLLRNLLTSKPIIDKKKCELCKSCENICPVKGIQVSKEKITFDYNKCIKCFCCQEICQRHAVRIKQGAILRALSFIKG